MPCYFNLYLTYMDILISSLRVCVCVYVMLRKARELVFMPLTSPNHKLDPSILHTHKKLILACYIQAAVQQDGNVMIRQG